MAMQFGDETLDRVVESCFRLAVARAGFELRTAVDKQPAGIIDNQMRAAILASRFVLSDATHGNHGAYWEAGYAERLGRPGHIHLRKEQMEEEQGTLRHESFGHGHLGP
jgi:hypothetical protein